MWFSIENVLSEVFFLLLWPFLYSLLLICFLSCLTVIYSSCPILLSASFISPLHLYDMIHHSLPSIFFHSLASHFSSLIPVHSFLMCSLLSFLLPVNVCIFSISLHTLLNTCPLLKWFLTLSSLSRYLQHWLTELEIFAMIFAAAVHDYEHTGTTNNFHIQTR